MLRRVLPRLYLLRPARPILPTAIRLPTPIPPPPSRLFRTPAPRLTSTPAEPSRPNENEPSLPPNAPVSQRLKHLVKSYGWYALGVYLVLSALDFTVAFAGISLLGAEQVSQATAYVKQVVLGLLHSKTPEPGRDELDTAASQTSHDGLYAMLVLAYTIHKTVFLPVRVGLTATLTPRIVGWLRARGWVGGEGAKRAAHEMRERIRIRKGQD